MILNPSAILCGFLMWGAGPDSAVLGFTGPFLCYNPEPDRLWHPPHFKTLPNPARCRVKPRIWPDSPAGVCFVASGTSDYCAVMILLKARDYASVRHYGSEEGLIRDTTTRVSCCAEMRETHSVYRLNHLGLRRVGPIQSSIRGFGNWSTQCLIFTSCIIQESPHCILTLILHPQSTMLHRNMNQLFPPQPTFTEQNLPDQAGRVRLALQIALTYNIEN